ncbi:MAG: tRNA (N6-isopentenyl adenosine(37)-C2)-methylthiotransferase MiaB [bacterium]
MKGRYSIVTFGCQMNKSDSETMAGILEEEGYSPVDSPKNSDVVLLNTCAVRGHSEHKAYSYLGKYKKFKKQNPDMIIGFTGCVAQKEGKELLDRFSHLDLVLGPQNLTGLSDYLRTIRQEDKRLLATEGKLEMVKKETPRTRREGQQAWVPIMTGCDKFCTFCIVPHTRGRERSRDPDDIVREIDELVDDGFREITLLGQTVNSYGKTLRDGVDFPYLLKKIDSIPGDYRIRFTSPHPMDTPPELIQCYDELDHLASHIHLPVQSGSDRILRRMNRKYTREEYLDIIDGIRSIDRDVAITTDVIIGFPGETEEDFEDTMQLFEEVRYDGAYLFKYSKRSGTPAAKMEDQVDDDIIADRHKRLMDLHEAITMEDNQSYVGKTVEVYVEGTSPKHTEDNPQFTGRTSTNEVVIFEALPERYIGEFVPVTINEAGSYTLFGNVEEPSITVEEPQPAAVG